MSDVQAAVIRAENDKRNYPNGVPQSQSQTGYDYVAQQAYENAMRRK